MRYSFNQARLSSRLVTADVFVTSWQKILLYRVLWTSYGRSENKMNLQKFAKFKNISKFIQNIFAKIEFLMKKYCIFWSPILWSPISTCREFLLWRHKYIGSKKRIWERCLLSTKFKKNLNLISNIFPFKETEMILLVHYAVHCPIKINELHWSVLINALILL